MTTSEVIQQYQQIATFAKQAKLNLSDAAIATLVLAACNDTYADDLSRIATSVEDLGAIVERLHSTVEDIHTAMGGLHVAVDMPPPSVTVQPTDLTAVVDAIGHWCGQICTRLKDIKVTVQEGRISGEG